MLLPEIDCQQQRGKKVVFRADAAFAKPEIYETLEERGVKYAIRLPANDSLVRDIEELLTRPVARPSHRPVVWYRGSLYQAASWKTARRVVAKVEFHIGELFPRVGFTVTNLEMPSRAVVRFYNKRGTAEQWIKEGKQAVKNDTAFLSSFPLERCATGVEPAGLQLGEPVAAPGAATTNRELVADQFTATFGEDRRAIGEACALLLASPGGRASEPAAIRATLGRIALLPVPAG